MMHQGGGAALETDAYLNCFQITTSAKLQKIKLFIIKKLVLTLQSHPLVCSTWNDIETDYRCLNLGFDNYSIS